MPKAYWVTSYRRIKDPDKLAAYAKLAGPAIAPFGGRYLARGTAAAPPVPVKGQATAPSGAPVQSVMNRLPNLSQSQVEEMLDS